MIKEYAEKINGDWIEKTPRQFRNERNASIPDVRLADEGLHEVTVDPSPDSPVAKLGPIVDREGLPHQTWELRTPTKVDVKAEAMRRILNIAPEWKQRNLTAQAAILAKKGEANWTTEEQAAWDAGEAVWTQISAIRAASDVLEVMDPMPTDYTADKHWP